MAISVPPGQSPQRPTAQELSTLNALLREMLEWVRQFVGLEVEDMIWVREGTATTLDPTTRRVQVTLDAWHDEPPAQVMAEYGAPTRTAREVEGKRVLAFQRRKDGRVILDAVEA